MKKKLSYLHKLFIYIATFLLLSQTIFLYAENLDNKIIKYRNLVKQYPYNDTFHYNLAIFLTQKNELNQAISELTKALAISKKAKYYLSLGLMYRDNNQLNRAISSLKAAINIKPDYSAVYRPLAELYYKSGQNDKALQILENGLILSPKDVGLLLLDSKISSQVKLVDRAIKDLKQVIAINSSNRDAHFYLYQLYYQLGNYDKALKEIFFLETFYPDSEDILLRKGELLIKVRKFKDAERNYSFLVSKKPDCSKCWLNYGISLYYLKDYFRSAKAFKRSYELDNIPNTLSNYKGMLSTLERKSLIFFNGGKYGKAEKILKKLLILEPEVPKYSNVLVKCYIRERKYREAKKVLDDLISKGYTAEKILFNRGIVCYNLHNYSCAEVSYKNLVKINPKNSKLWINLGGVLEKEKKYDEAISAYIKFLSLEPSSQYAKTIKDRISYLGNQLKNTSTQDGELP